jgi:hypothetical protein
MLDQIECREYNTKVPTWIRKLVKKREDPQDQGFHPNGGGGGGGGGGRGNKRRQFRPDEDKRVKRITNNDLLPSCKLGADLQLRDVFHPRNLKGVLRPKLQNGNSICHRYHSLGFCFHDCKHADSHGALKPEEAAAFSKYVKNAVANQMEFKSGNGGRQPQDVVPKKTPQEEGAAAAQVNSAGGSGN